MKTKSLNFIAYQLLYWIKACLYTFRNPQDFMFLRIGKKKTGDVKTNSKDDVSKKASELSKQNTRT